MEENFYLRTLYFGKYRSSVGRYQCPCCMKWYSKDDIAVVSDITEEDLTTMNTKDIIDTLRLMCDACLDEQDMKE